MLVTAVVSLFAPLIVVCPARVVAFGKRSRATPVTRTSWPALTLLLLFPVKTKIPSDVAALPSPVGSWM